MTQRIFPGSSHVPHPQQRTPHPSPPRNVLSPRTPYQTRSGRASPSVDEKPLHHLVEQRGASSSKPSTVKERVWTTKKEPSQHPYANTFERRVAPPSQQKKPTSPLFRSEKEESTFLQGDELKYIRWIMEKSYDIESKENQENLTSVLSTFLKGIEKRIYAKKQKAPWHLYFGLCGSTAGKVFFVNDQISDVDIILDIELDFDYTHLLDISERDRQLEREIKKIFNIVRNSIEEEINFLRSSKGLKTLCLDQVNKGYVKKYERHMEWIQWDHLSDSAGKRYALYSIGRNRGLTIDLKPVVNITFKKEGREDCWVAGVKDFSAFKKDSFLVPLDPYLRGSWKNLKAISTTGPIAVAFQELSDKKLSTDNPRGDKLFAAVKSITKKGFGFKDPQQEQAISQNFADHFINEHLVPGLLKRLDPNTTPKPYAILTLINLFHVCDEILSLSPEQKKELKQKLSNSLPLYLTEEIPSEMEETFFDWCRLATVLSHPSDENVVSVSMLGKNYHLRLPDDCIELWSAFAKQETEEALSLCLRAFPFPSDTKKEIPTRAFLTERMKEVILKRHGTQLSRCLHQLISEGSLLSLELAHILYMDPQAQEALMKHPLPEELIVKLVEHVSSNGEPATFDPFWRLTSEKKFLTSSEWMFPAQVATFKNYRRRGKAAPFLKPLVEDMMAFCETSFRQNGSKENIPQNPSEKVQKKGSRSKRSPIVTPLKPVKNSSPLSQEVGDLLLSYIGEFSGKATSFLELESLTEYLLKLLSIYPEKKEVCDLAPLLMDKACSLAELYHHRSQTWNLDHAKASGVDDGGINLKPSSQTPLFALFSSGIGLYPRNYLPLLNALLLVDPSKGKELLEILHEKNLLGTSDDAKSCVLHFLAQFLTKKEHKKNWIKTLTKFKTYLSNNEQKRAFFLEILQICKETKDLLLLRQLYLSLLPVDWFNLKNEKAWLIPKLIFPYLDEINKHFKKPGAEQFLHLMDHFSWLIESRLLTKTEAHQIIATQFLKQWGEDPSIFSTEKDFQKISRIYKFVPAGQNKERAARLHDLIMGCFHSYDPLLIQKGENLLRQGTKEKLFSSEETSSLFSTLIHAQSRLGASATCDALLKEALEQEYFSKDKSPELLLKAYEDLLLNLLTQPSPKNIKQKKLQAVSPNQAIKERRVKELFENPNLRSLLVNTAYPRTISFMTALLEEGIANDTNKYRRLLIGLLVSLYKMDEEFPAENNPFSKNLRNEKLVTITDSLSNAILDNCDLQDWRMLIPLLLTAHQKGTFANHSSIEARIYTKAISQAMEALKELDISKHGEEEKLLLGYLEQFIPSFQPGKDFPGLFADEKEIFLCAYVEQYAFHSGADKTLWKRAITLFEMVYQPSFSQISPALARLRGLVLENLFEGIIKGHGIDYLLEEPHFSYVLRRFEECFQKEVSSHLFNPAPLTLELLQTYCAVLQLKKNELRGQIQPVVELIEKQSSSKDLHRQIKEGYKNTLNHLSAYPNANILVAYIRTRALKAKILDQELDGEFLNILTLRVTMANLTVSFSEEIFPLLAAGGLAIPLEVDIQKT